MKIAPLLGLLLLLTLRPGTSSGAQPVDGFAAEVAGNIITVGDVIETIRPQLSSLGRQYSGRELVQKQTELFNRGLETLIAGKLMLAKFERMEAEMPPGVVRERTESILRERFDNDRSQLLTVLRAVGKSEQEWEEEIRQRLIEQSMTQQFVRQQINVSPREIRAAYEEQKQELIQDVELKLRAIAFRFVPEEDRTEREKKIERVLTMLEEGGDFAEVAREYSEGPKASSGGDQGWMTLSRLPDPLPSALANTKPGEITGLIDTPSQSQSWVFLIEDRRGGALSPLAEVQDQLKRKIQAEKYRQRYDEWIEGLKKEFPITRYNPDISAVTGEQ